MLLLARGLSSAELLITWQLAIPRVSDERERHPKLQCLLEPNLVRGPLTSAILHCSHNPGTKWEEATQGVNSRRWVLGAMLEGSHHSTPSKRI